MRYISMIQFTIIELFVYHCFGGLVDISRVSSMERFEEACLRRTLLLITSHLAKLVKFTLTR